MSESGQTAETLTEFKNSFFYGSRKDLSFKFLSHLGAEDAGRFFQDLLQATAAGIDNNDLEPIEKVVHRWQVEGYRKQKNFDYDSGPFCPLPKPASDLRLALLTSSGHFAAGDDPQPLGVAAMSQQEAENRVQEFLRRPPQLSEIPVDIRPSDLRLRHGGYDVGAATIDPNVTFPLTLLKQLAAEGIVAELTSPAYSFVGACAQGRLLKREGPEWAARIKSRGVEAVLLVPV